MPDPSTHRSRRIRRTFPLLGLLLYYGGLAAFGLLLITYVPGFRGALAAPFAEAAQGPLTKTAVEVASPAGASPWSGLGGRGALAFVAMSWALAMTLPVAWVLMRTRRLRYDPSLVHTLLMLPIVVAGVVLVVKNSLALAFALAGIVAGVRFRQKLEEPEEAVYVLLALGIGLAAGVQALDVALVMSMTYTLVVMTFWRFDLGDIYGKGRGAQLAIGDVRALAPYTRAAARDFQQHGSPLAEGMKPDGLLMVRTPDSQAARRAIETVAGRLASEWRMADPVTDNGQARVTALVTLKKNSDPAELVAELEERWSDEISAAEYVPLASPIPDDRGDA